MKSRILLLLFSFATAASACDLIGTWRLIDKRIDSVGLEIVWEFTATEVIVRDAKRNEELSRATYSLDESKEPKWITVDVSDAIPSTKPDKRLGIYVIAGDFLRLNQEIQEGGQRPVDFGAVNVREFSRIQK